MRPPRSRPRPRARAVGVALLVVIATWLTACGADDPPPARPVLTIGSAGTPGSVAAAGRYAGILRDAGYDARTVPPARTREQAMFSIEQGTVDIVAVDLRDLRAYLAGQDTAVPAGAATDEPAALAALLPALTQRRLVAYPPATGSVLPVVRLGAANLRLQGLLRTAG